MQISTGTSFQKKKKKKKKRKIPKLTNSFAKHVVTANLLKNKPNHHKQLRGVRDSAPDPFYDVGPNPRE